MCRWTKISLVGRLLLIARGDVRVVQWIDLRLHTYTFMISKRVMKAIGQKLKIRDYLKLFIYPSPNINFEDIAFANFKWGFIRPAKAKGLNG